MYFTRACQPFSLPTPIYNAVSTVLSPARLTPYLSDAGGNVSLAMRRYRWNMLVVESLTIPLNFSEVCIRNAIYETFQANLGRNWLSYSEPSLDINTKRIILDAEVKLTKENIRKGRPYLPTQGQLIAEMTFGFWHFFCQTRHHHFLWRGNLGSRFHHAPPGTSPSDLFRVMSRLLKARNRFAHHEPVIWNNPVRIFDDCMTLIEWTAGRDIRRMVAEDLSSFNEVMNARPV